MGLLEDMQSDIADNRARIAALAFEVSSKPDPPPIDDPPGAPEFLWNDRLKASTNMPLMFGPGGLVHSGMGDMIRTPEGLRVDYKVRPWNKAEGPRNEFGRWRASGQELFAWEPLNEERWYSFRIRIDEADQTPEDDSNKQVLFQIHGPSGMNPCISLNYYVAQRRWVWWARSDPKPHRIVWPEEDPNKTVGAYSGNMTYNTWVQWTLRARWSSGEDGLLELYRDGILDIGWRGQNYYSGDRRPTQQMGVYYPNGRDETPDHSDASRRVWFKDYKIGDETNTIKDFT